MKNFYFLFCLFFLTACVTTGGQCTAPLASRVVVVKSERMLYLVDPYGVPYRSYKVAMGGNPVGPKQCEGDERTPEGSYVIEAHNPDSHYHLSLKISYPNKQDVARAKAMGLPPGSDIFIHGVPNDAWFLKAYMYQFEPEWTNGCIAVTNHDIEEIWQLVPDGTPIEIMP